MVGTCCGRLVFDKCWSNLIVYLMAQCQADVKIFSRIFHMLKIKWKYMLAELLVFSAEMDVCESIHS